MKHAIVYIVCFAIVIGVGAGVYLSYSNYEAAIEFDDLTVGHTYIDSKGVFKGSFSTKHEGMLLSRFEHEIKGSTLYITLYETTNENKALKHSKDNYADIEIPGCKNIKKLYYRYDGEKDSIKLSN